MSQYVYDAYRSPYADSIAESIAAPGRVQAQGVLNAGQAQAQGQQQRGAIWGNAVGNLGQIAGQAIQTYNSPASKLTRVMKQTPKIDLGNGVMGYDVGAISDALAKQGADPTEAAKHLSDINESFQQVYAVKLAAVTRGAVALRAAGGDPELALDFLDTVDKNHLYPPAQTAQLRAMIKANPTPETVNKILTLFAGPEKFENAAPGSMARSAVTGAVIPGSAVPDKPTSPTRASLATAAAGGDANAKAALDLMNPPVQAPSSQEAKFLYKGKAVQGSYVPDKTGTGGKYFYNGQDVSADATPIPAASTVVNPQAVTDVKEAVTGMREGTIPPMLPGRASKEYLATMAEAHRQGYDLQAAVTDWNATQKHIATLNGAQQTRLNQAINALPELLDSVDALAAQWNGGRFPVLNRANLALAKGGAYGDAVATVARQLESQIADVNADLAVVYMGGNSPTDHGLELASKALAGDWSRPVLRDMVQRAKGNVTIRQNSIRNTGVQGASATNPYAPAAVPEAVSTTLKGQKAGRYTLSDGSVWLVDANGGISSAGK